MNSTLGIARAACCLLVLGSLLPLAATPRSLAEEEPAPAAADAAPAPLDVEGFWTSAERALIARGLDILNVTEKDLGFQKRPIDDPFRLGIVDRVLDEPLLLGQETAEWDAVARTGNASEILWKAMTTLLERKGMRFSSHPENDANAPAIIPPAAAGAYGRLLLAMDSVAQWPVDRLAGLGEDRDPLLRKILLSQVEKPATPTAAVDMTDARFLELAATLDLAKLVGAGQSLVEPVQDFVAALRAAAPVDSLWTGTVRIERASGDIVITGHGDDTHEADDGVALIIDLGGNDTWKRGASASVLRGRPVSVCIDLSGEDRYIGRADLSFGAALGGFAVQWDAGEGDDFWDGGHASLGAGLCGIGVLVDDGGDDVYRCHDFGQGAGIFGAGLLLDKSGNDLFHADLFGQGYASTQGCGVLVDLSGNDTYDAGGAHLHAPLYNDRYQSLSQGFSIGMRPDASGGVGVLVDVKGNDRYTADIYGQGASYWYALGILVDGDGNDTYNLGQYGQGSGIHLAAGMLLDRAGSDLYYLKNGVGMGGAHDYSVGLLVDRGGDDYYAGSGGTQGGALTNSFAMLLDGGGNDAYAAVNPGGAQGGASRARGTGGLGLLLDAGGSDAYTETRRDGGVWTKELMGAGLDETASVAAAGTGDPGATTFTAEQAQAAVLVDGRVPGPDGTPVFDLDALWKIACRWEVGDNRIIVPAAREHLVALGAPALDRAMERVGTKDGLEFRAVESTLARFPAEDVVPLLLARTEEEDVAVRKGAVRALASLGAQAALPRLTVMLGSDAPSRGTVLAALATLRHAPPEVALHIRSPKEPEGVQAVLCLAAVGGSDAIAALCDSLGPDVPFPVRMAVVDRVGALAPLAVARLSSMTEDATLPAMTRRNALRALGLSKSADATDAIALALFSDDPLVSFSAYEAGRDLLADLGPEKGEDIALAIKNAREMESEPLPGRMR
jgi:HEAT repeat protein